MNSIHQRILIWIVFGSMLATAFPVVMDNGVYALPVSSMEGGGGRLGDSCLMDTVVDQFGVQHFVQQNMTNATNLEVYYSNSNRLANYSLPDWVRLTNTTYDSVCPQITIQENHSFIFVTWVERVNSTGNPSSVDQGPSFYLVSDNNGTEWLHPFRMRYVEEIDPQWNLSVVGDVLFLTSPMNGTVLYHPVSLPWLQRAYQVSLGEYEFDVRMGEPELPADLRIDDKY